MKNLICLIAAICLVGLVACNKDQSVAPATVAVPSIDSKAAVESLALQEKYDLPQDIYVEFLNSLIFVDSELQSFMYGNIDRYLGVEISREFFVELGVILVAEEGANQRNDLEVLLEDTPGGGGSQVLMGYKYKGPNSCKLKKNWACRI